MKSLAKSTCIIFVQFCSQTQVNKQDKRRIHITSLAEVLILHVCIVVEGCKAHSAGTFIETGLTATKYVPQLFVTFDILPDNVDYKEIENATTECSECYLALLQLV